MNDKVFAIGAIAVIGIVAMFALSDGSAKEIALVCVGGITGFVTGQAIERFKKEKSAPALEEQE
jgi:outer membrane lipoprotein SlyB